MKVFANTDAGLVRQLNEDDYCIAHNANDEWMAIVCDGIGMFSYILGCGIIDQ